MTKKVHHFPITKLGKRKKRSMAEPIMVILLTFISVFQLKLKKRSHNTASIDAVLITVNIFFAHWVKEISMTKYGSDKELPPTFSL